MARNNQAAEYLNDDPLDDKHLGAFVECQDSLAAIQKLLDDEINRLKALETKDISEFDLSLPGWADFEIREIQEHRRYLANTVLKWCKNRSLFFSSLRRSYLQEFRKDTTMRIGNAERACLKELRVILKQMVMALSFREFQGPYRFSLRRDCETLLERIYECLRRAFDDTSPHKKLWFGRYESRGQYESASQEHLDEISSPQDSRISSDSSSDIESQLPIGSCTSFSEFLRLATAQPLKYMEGASVCLSLIIAILVSCVQKNVGNGFTVGAYFLGASQVLIVVILKCMRRRSPIILEDIHED